MTTVQQTITLKDGDGKSHYYPIDATGKPLPMEPEQYAEFAKLGGREAIYGLQVETSPFRPYDEHQQPDTFDRDRQNILVDGALDQFNHPEKYARGSTPEEVEANRQAILAEKQLRHDLDVKQQEADNPPPLSDEELAVLSPRTEQEWMARAMKLQEGWARLDFDLVRVPEYGQMQNINGASSEPVLEVRPRGSIYAMYRGGLAAIERRYQMDAMSRARRDKAVADYEAYKAQKKQELADSIADSPAAKIARQERELAELKRRDAERDAEFKAMQYQITQQNQRQREGS